MTDSVWTKSSHSGMHDCVEFRKSSRSSSNDGCVEFGQDGGTILIRDSKDPQGPVLTFTPHEWKMFLLGVKDGEFDI